MWSMRWSGDRLLCLTSSVSATIFCYIDLPLANINKSMFGSIVPSLGLSAVNIHCRNNVRSEDEAHPRPQHPDGYDNFAEILTRIT